MSTASLSCVGPYPLPATVRPLDARSRPAHRAFFLGAKQAIGQANRRHWNRLMRLRLATWNINSVRLRAEQVARFVAEQSPDLLCLQEIK